jgi:hypothetical protein
MYLIICEDQSAFTTTYYHPDWWNENKIHCVINMNKMTISFDGKEWKEIQEDHL